MHVGQWWHVGFHHRRGLRRHHELAPARHRVETEGGRVERVDERAQHPPQHSDNAAEVHVRICACPETRRAEDHPAADLPDVAGPRDRVHDGRFPQSHLLPAGYAASGRSRPLFRASCDALRPKRGGARRTRALCCKTRQRLAWRQGRGRRRRMGPGRDPLLPAPPRLDAVAVLGLLRGLEFAGVRPLQSARASPEGDRDGSLGRRAARHVQEREADRQSQQGPPGACWNRNVKLVDGGKVRLDHRHHDERCARCPRDLVAEEMCFVRIDLFAEAWVRDEQRRRAQRWRC
mmetsp:Transcript_8189/g.23390  ORF Transcript_8189/g.23390 Transcript_8189/m.23390 type:complete len:290 (+) Transcript_8189:980-1849(+)